MLLLSATLALASSIDRSLLDAVVKRHYNQVRYCYERRLPQRPTLAGRVVGRFELELDGTISSAEIAESTLGDTVVEDCLVARFLEWGWPEGKTRYVVRYPLLFTRKDRAKRR